MIGVSRYLSVTQFDDCEHSECDSHKAWKWLQSVYHHTVNCQYRAASHGSTHQIRFRGADKAWECSKLGLYVVDSLYADERIGKCCVRKVKGRNDCVRGVAYIVKGKNRLCELLCVSCRHCRNLCVGGRWRLSLEIFFFRLTVKIRIRHLSQNQIGIRSDSDGCIGLECGRISNAD